MTTASDLADELERAEDFLNDPNRFAISRRLRDRILSALRRVEPGPDQPRPSVSEDICDAPSLRESLTPELEARCLSFDPFSGDETDVSDLSDGFVKGRKDYECQHCAGPIYKGERHRAKAERNNEDHILMTFRFCPPCCAAMAVYNDYDETTDTINADYEDRLTLGTARRDPDRYTSYLKAGVPGLPPALAVELATVPPSNRKDGSSPKTTDKGGE